MDDLSTVQNKVLDYIIEYKKLNDGNSPTYRSIARELLLAHSNIYRIVGILKRKGYLKDTTDIQVSGGNWRYEKE